MVERFKASSLRGATTPEATHQRPTSAQPQRPQQCHDHPETQPARNGRKQQQPRALPATAAGPQHGQTGPNQRATREPARHAQQPKQRRTHQRPNSRRATAPTEREQKERGQATTKPRRAQTASSQTSDHRKQPERTTGTPPLLAFAGARARKGFSRCRSSGARAQEAATAEPAAPLPRPAVQLKDLAGGLLPGERSSGFPVADGGADRLVVGGTRFRERGGTARRPTQRATRRTQGASPAAAMPAPKSCPAPWSEGEAYRFGKGRSPRPAANGGRRGGGAQRRGRGAAGAYPRQNAETSLRFLVFSLFFSAFFIKKPPFSYQKQGEK